MKSFRNLVIPHPIHEYFSSYEQAQRQVPDPEMRRKSHVCPVPMVSAAQAPDPLSA